MGSISNGKVHSARNTNPRGARLVHVATHLQGARKEGFAVREFRIRRGTI